MLGKIIRDYLNENGIDLSLVAENLNMPIKKITRELHQKDIDCIFYYKLCKFLELPLDFFMNEVDA